MSEIKVIEANTKALLKDYVTFPFSLYKDNPNWVPPIISEELQGFDKNINPAFDTAEATFYLAYKDSKIVGRIAAIINWDEVKNQKKLKVRFGWWDVIDDIEVTKVLLEKVIELGKKHKLNHIEGPMGFSNLDKVGVLTEGFDELGSMITWYNFPYYKEHLETLGYIKEKEYNESQFDFSNVDPKFFYKAQNLIKERYQLKILTFTKTKKLMPYVDEMFDIFNSSYAKLSSFVAITERQKAYFKKKYISFINPEYILFVLDKNNKMVAFSIVMPSFSEALIKTKGKLLPFGFYHMLEAKKNSKEVLFYLIGVVPEYQNKGVHSIIFNEYYNVFKQKGIISCIRTPELSDNIAMHNIWKNIENRIIKKRSTYLKEL